MATALTIPKLGLTMTQGTVTEWLIEDGATVEPGRPVYVLVTDKTETEVDAEEAGTLHQVATPGTTLKPGEVAGWLLADGEAPPAPATPTAADEPPDAASAEAGAAAASVAATNVERSESTGRLFVSPNARRIAAERGINVASISGTGPGGRIVSEDVDTAAATGASAAARSTTPQVTLPTGPVSPLAAALADRLGVDLASTTGSGPGERVRLEDVLAAAGQLSSSVDSTSSAPPAPLHQPGDRIRMSPMRNVIAQRMSGALQEMAQLTLTREVGVDALLDLRAQLKREWPDQGLTVPSVTDLVVKAVARSLSRHPLLNASLVDDEIITHAIVDIGLAVAVPDGLMVPVVRAADDLPLSTLAQVTRTLATKAQHGELTPDDLAAPTFTVSALGGLGVDAFTPIINPPNVAILGVGRARNSVAWEGDQPVRRRVMTLSLTIDHRVVDGAPGAELLATLDQQLGRPLGLLG